MDYKTGPVSPRRAALTLRTGRPARLARGLARPASQYVPPAGLQEADHDGSLPHRVMLPPGCCEPIRAERAEHIQFSRRCASATLGSRPGQKWSVAMLLLLVVVVVVRWRPCPASLPPSTLSIHAATRSKSDALDPSGTSQREGTRHACRM